MRNYHRSTSQVNRARRELGRESRATLRAGLGLVPKLGTGIGIYDTANGAAKTARAAARYCGALKQQTTTRVRTKINSVTKPVRRGINTVHRLLY